MSHCNTAIRQSRHRRNDASQFGAGRYTRFAVAAVAVVLACQGRSELEFFQLGPSATSFGGATPANTLGSGAVPSSSVGGSANQAKGGALGAAPTVRSEPRVCVFDYDLTLSSHLCAYTQDTPGYACRENTCDTYGWYSQCLAQAARKAVAECVRRRAYIGIASKADVDYCWRDKVETIVAEQQFPELTSGVSNGLSVEYPRVDDRANWNCNDCAYTMDGGLSKPEGIRRILRHYGFNPLLPLDRARVIFWDDTLANVQAVRAEMPEVKSILVPSFTGAGVDGGCGITDKEIEAGWAD